MIRLYGWLPLWIALAVVALGAAPATAQGRVERDRDLQQRATERDRDRELEGDDQDDGQDEDERDDEGSAIDTTIAFGRQGVIDLTLVSGEIKVVGWDRNEAKVSARSDGGIIRFDHSPSRLSLDVRSNRGRMGDTRYELSVPTGTRVLMRSVSGDLSARAVRGEVEARAVSGSVEVSGAVNKVALESVSGDVRGSSLEGDVRANTVSGELVLDGVRGDVGAETVSGGITLKRTTSKFVRAETVSGDVAYDGVAVDPAGRYEFHSHSGDLRLTLPAALAAHFGLETFSGDIDSDFPLTLQPGASSARRKRFEFNVGGGGARITAETFSGNIELQRATRSTEGRRP